MYDTRNVYDRYLTVGVCMKRWMPWVGLGAVLRRNVTTHVDMHFIRCAEEQNYAIRLALIVRNGSQLAYTDPITRSLEYVAFPRPCDSFQLLNGVVY